ncbi:nuclear GTPase SLIP-GC-like isoform X1 [Micropterus salmoides]|uniref:nuclear GTPase SLIP-GC-like isoform X1 n=1 Tax=Micropterus salmoides TaxID=27706 RepID=UPI0018EB46C7|nr:nuclear GTPase SLIP-GC-like isoform X1 [Micropterus salmoides]
MDDFVRNKLSEWGLSEWIERFEDEEIDEEIFHCLDDKEIANLIPKIGPRSIFKTKLKFLQKEQNTTNQETVCFDAQVWPSTSDSRDKGKRKLDLQGESSKSPSRKRRHDIVTGLHLEKINPSDVKIVMRYVNERIPNQENRFNKFLKTKINDLETDKRELVGVFGKTGAGKSSLINAVIREKNLLPSGSVSACTSVMIKVEANMLNSKYEAEIEFITKEELEEELWYFKFLWDNADQDEEDDDAGDTTEKLSALYGEEWKNKSLENLMDNKYFSDIPEFLRSKSKIFTCESAKELSAKLVKYTRSDLKDRDSTEVKRWYWPLVKCVTVRVPGNDLLQHVTLVDLPGNGDRNKSRDEMWKAVVGRCSTVWIVTDINRAAAEKEPWEILKIANSRNGGVCQFIHFICTKSDLIEDSDDHSAAGVRALILKRNNQAKEEVNKEFSKLKVKKHFRDNCFKVFTVSSKETHLSPDETEIPKLQQFLQHLNDCHSETLNYVSGAYEILSLIQRARCREVADKTTNVCTDLEEDIRHELEKVRKPMEEACNAFEKCLSKGVEKSKSSCERVLKSVLHPVSGCAFHKTLRSVVENNGTFKPKIGKQINLNAEIAACLTDSINEEFLKTFPNEKKCGPFNGVINMFALDTKRLIEKHKDVKLQLIFLKTEEEQIKTLLNKIIRVYKKTIYSDLTTTIEENMQECYEKAAEKRGHNSLKNMRNSIEKYVRDPKNTMFEQAKDFMLSQLRCLKEYSLKILEETMQKSIEMSLRTDCDSLPDVTVELETVKKCYHELRGSPDEETLICADPPGPAAAP